MMPDELNRKRLLYRSNYRGTKENDFVFGQYAREHIMTMSAVELKEFETLLDEVNEPTLWDWVAGLAPIDPKYHFSVLDKIIAFHLERSTDVSSRA